MKSIITIDVAFQILRVSNICTKSDSRLWSSVSLLENTALSDYSFCCQQASVLLIVLLAVALVRLTDANGVKVTFLWD